MSHEIIDVAHRAAMLARIAEAAMFRRVAGLVADELFVNGFGEKVRRLLLELDDGRHGGGWCRSAVADRVERILIDELAGKGGES